MTSPLVDLPSASADRPSWVKVSVIATVCFVVGIAWPKLAGVRLGPSAPGDSAATAHGTEPTSSATALTAPATPPPVAPAASATAVASAPAIPASAHPTTTNVSVKPGVLVSCKNEDGDVLKGKACGALAFDAVALPRLKKLAECPASAGADGKLSVMFHLEFAKSGRLNVGIGKSSTVEKPEEFTSCLTSAFEGATVAGLAHDNPRYTVAYAVRFGREAGGDAQGGSTGGAPTAPPAATAAIAATGSAPPASMASASSGDAKDAGEVVWDVAIVRDKARTGDVVARLPRGTKVRVATFQDGWYQIGFGDGMTSEGWVYRRAIGK